MKHVYGLLIVIVFLPAYLHAQDEGQITKKARIGNSSNIFLNVGPSFTLGDNIGDYSTGFSFEIGYQKRVNRVLAIGPSLSVLRFKYDADKTGLNNAFISEIYDENGDYDYDLGVVIDFSGGDLMLTSLAVNLKLNLVPVKDKSVISPYLFAKPFVSYVSRSEVKGVAELYTNTFEPDYWEYIGEVPWEANNQQWADVGLVISDDLKADNTITGGIFLGPGVEFLPGNKISFYAQAAFGYTFPISFVSSKSYVKTRTIDDLTESYPIVKEGFPSINVQVGLSYNF
jgi:hypothetical protein